MVISQGIKDQALNHAKERMKYEFNRFGFNDDQRLSMILIGTIGQLLFKQYLDENNIDYEYEMQAGQYDLMDFKIRDQIVEIKTSGFSDSYNHLNLLYSLDQYQSAIRKDFVYCVQIFIEGYDRKTKLLDLNACNNGYIAGYMPFENFPQYRNLIKRSYGDDYKIPLSNLISISSLINN